MISVKVLIVGGGGIGERHLCCLLATGRAHVSICEAREERLEFLRAKYQIQETYTDFFDIPLSQYQGVIIATPAHLHIPMAMECAKVGVPFLVEKPLSVDLNGVDQLIALVDEKGIQAGVAYMRRNLPSYKKLREHAESGLIGEVKMGRFNSSQNYRKYRPDYKEIYYAKEDQGGGCILDAASHFINLAQWYFGEVENLVALSDRLVFEGVEAEDSAIIIMRFAAGSLVEVFCNQFQQPDISEIELIGTRGNLKYVNEGGRHRIYLCQDDSNNWQELASFEVEGDVYYMGQAQNFLSVLEGNEEFPTTLQEGKRTLELALAAKKWGSDSAKK